MTNTKIKNKKVYTGRFDRTLKEIMLKEDNRDLLKCLIATVLGTNKSDDITEKNIEINQGKINIKRKNLDILLEIGNELLNIEANNHESIEYTRIRNTAYVCSLYASYIKKGEDYQKQKKVNIIQINLYYGVGKRKIKKEIEEYSLQNEKGEKVVENLKIIEVNMDRIMKFWYAKDEEKIKKYKYLIMLNLKPKELKELIKITNDRKVEKYMINIIGVSTGEEYMTEEEDRQKWINTIEAVAEEKGISKGKKENQRSVIKNLLKENMPISKIAKIVGLSEKKVNKIITTL